MFFSTLTFLMCLFAAANAHFRLLYPLPRGVFVADNEPNFCGGYTEVTTNRTAFPLSGGFFTIKSGHGDFTVGAILSTVHNPNSFDNFSVNGVQQVASPYAKTTDAGTYCIPLNISATGINGVKDGAHVTLQIVFAGGDGNLSSQVAMCADLMLQANLTTPSDVSCTNETTTATSTTPAATSTKSSASTSGSLSVVQQASGAIAFLFGVCGVAASFI